ncbi:MAG: divalent metal cation transporter [Thermoanaerobacteraceae bacterium]|nr:divalent metal cation transporter [Thermoanaerobacteraceae bacterium]
MATKDVTKFEIPEGSIFKKLSYILSFIGAGSVLMSEAMGPGTATSCVTAGAQFGYMLLWIIVLSGIMNGVVAYIGGKMAVLSGKNAYEYIKDNTSQWFANGLIIIVLITWYLVIFSQGATIKHLTDIMFGSKFSTPAFIITVLAIGYIFASGKNRVIAIASAMCTAMAVIYLINAIYIKPDPVQLVNGLVPRLPSIDKAVIVAGIIGGSAPGTSALWYSYSVKDNKWKGPKALNYIAWDQIYFAFLFTIFSIGIYLSGAAVLHPAGIQVNSALDAAKAIGPLAGEMGKWIFVLGLWGAVFTTIGGMSSLGSYAINSIFKMGESLNDQKVKRITWVGIILSLFGGMVKGNVLGLLVYFLGLLNVGGFVLISLLTYYTSSEKHAGEYKNKWYITLIGIVICGFNFYAVLTYIQRFL